MSWHLPMLRWLRRSSYHTTRYITWLLIGALLFFPGMASRIVVNWFAIPLSWQPWINDLSLMMVAVGGVIALAGYVMILLIWFVRFLDK